MAPSNAKQSDKHKSTRKKKRNHVAMQPPYDLYANPSSPSFEEGFGSIAKILEGCKRILVLAGAGVSVSCGIPDFRSQEGLYSTLDIQTLGLSCPEDLFDYEVFCEDPRPFFKFAKKMYFPKDDETPLQPSCSHKFLAMLEKQKRLLRVYTQNMDGLEEVAGVSSKRMVYAHGSLQCATCCKCKTQVPASELRQDILQGTVPKCKQEKEERNNSNNVKEATCTTATSQRPSRKRRQSEVDQELDIDKNKCGGVLKPNVTFFGETLCNTVRKSLVADRSKADALIVIGTSLSVAPMSKVIQYLPPNIPRILINRTLVHPPTWNNEDDDSDEEAKDFRTNYVFDACLLGFCDDVTRALVKEFSGNGNNSDETKDGKLLATLSENDEFFLVDDWKAYTKVPHDRVFLFPGAIMGGNANDDLTYREIAHCDGCAQEILQENIFKCSQCFDYDLCADCYPGLCKTHANGEHTFVTEPCVVPASAVMASK